MFLLVYPYLATSSPPNASTVLTAAQIHLAVDRRLWSAEKLVTQSIAGSDNSAEKFKARMTALSLSRKIKQFFFIVDSWKWNLCIMFTVILYAQRVTLIEVLHFKTASNIALHFLSFLFRNRYPESLAIASNGQTLSHKGDRALKSFIFAL